LVFFWNWFPRLVPKVNIGTGKSTAGASNEQGPTNLRTLHTPIPVLSPMMQIVTAPFTRDIMINTLTQPPEEAKVNNKELVAKYVHRGLECVTLLYDWASHRPNLCVGYKTPMLSQTDDNIFAVFKTIVDEFSPEEDKLNETYPEANSSFTKNEMHDVLHCDGGKKVKIAPSLRHTASLYIPESCAITSYLISEFKYNFCALQSRNSTSSISAMSCSSGSDK
jgi:hypothetical protein